MEVARIGAHSWAISVRGFNGDVANKLLVLIDGRSVYTPLYSGVFWDVQDTLLEDVDRIEVVCGPGGALWGANAVNGVINIITRSARDTEGGWLEAGGGNEEQGFGGFRYGGRVGESAFARAYVKYFNRDAAKIFGDGASHDDWRMGQGGFRLDWDATDSDLITLQGDVYGGEEGGQFRGDFTLGTLPGETFTDNLDVEGANLLGRWTRQIHPDSDLALQIYYDHTGRDIPNTFEEQRDTLDVDFQHRFQLGARNEALWGAGLRATRDSLDNSVFAAFDPDSRTDLTFSAFLQDKITLWEDRLFLTLGSKFEHNDYTGFEIQPSARLAWLVSDRQTLWTAVSRAVRIPSRLDADLHLLAPISIPSVPFPVYVNVNGNHDFDSEELLAYEAGYRIAPRDDLSFDLAVFYNEYDRLQTTEAKPPIVVAIPPLPYIILPNDLENNMQGESYGGTLQANWQLRSNWRWQFAYCFFDLELHNDRGSVDANSHRIEGNSPQNQFSVHSFLEPAHDLSLFAGLRYVDNVPNQDIHGYTALDLNVSWRPRTDLEASITAQNALDDRHPEFGAGRPSEVERSVYGKVTWRF